jgi:uncharacterized protein (DUF1697 family)
MLISMLRGINVGGQKTIRMAELQRLYESLGFVQVQTYLQSGNVIFDPSRQDLETLSHDIEAAIQQTFGYPVSVFIRTSGDFQRILVMNPFVHTQPVDLSKLHVTFLSQVPSPDQRRTLESRATSGDELIVGV